MNVLTMVLTGISTVALLGCQSNEADTGPSDTATASDEQPGNSTEDGSSDGTDIDLSTESDADTSSDSETLNWNDFDIICYAADCVDDTCRGFGADECPDCPTMSEIADLERLEDTTGFAEEYICYYPPACGGSICTRLVNAEDLTGWTCAVRPC